MLRNADPQAFSAVYVVCSYTDMRLGIDSLATIIQSRYQLPVFAPEVLFLFCGRRANKIKGLLWEGDGFLLLTKRVESGHFSWPRNSKESTQMKLRFRSSVMTVPLAAKAICGYTATENAPINTR